MEAYKNFQKDLKKKAFSKEGLNQRAKLSSEEQARSDREQDIQECIERLEGEIDDMKMEEETMIEQIRLMKSGNAQKKKSEDLKILVEKIQRHSRHVENSKILLKGLNNGNITPESLEETVENLKAYLDESNV